MTQDSQPGLARRLKRHVISQLHDFYAIVQPGFEAIAVAELQELGIVAIVACDKGGVTFQAKIADMYRVSVLARTISRILMRLDNFKATGWDELQHKTEAIAWELYLARDTAVDLRISSKGSRLFHTGRIAQEMESAVRQRLARTSMSDRKGVQAGSGASLFRQNVFVRGEANRWQLSLDCSGELLFRRGLKPVVGIAPLRETVAAAILRAARIREYDIVFDPMCGAGTFCLEAAYFMRMGEFKLTREFAFQHWPAFRPPAFRFIVSQTEKNWPAASSQTMAIYAADNDEHALRHSRQNFSMAGLSERIRIAQSDFLASAPFFPLGAKTLIVLNPPYGNRMQDKHEAGELYRRIGRRLRRDFPDCGYAVIVAGLEFEKKLQLPYDRKVPFINGGIPVAVLIKDSPLLS